MAITPDGKHAYVTNDMDGTVSVITTATGAVSAPITVGRVPDGVAICPDAERPPTPMMTVPAAVPTPTLAPGKHSAQVAQNARSGAVTRFTRTGSPASDSFLVIGTQHR